MLAIATFAVVMAVCLGIAAAWLIDDTKPNRRDNMKLFDVYGEFVVTKQITTIEAETEAEAVAKAEAQAAIMAKDLGVDTPEILWAEEEEQ
jgi:hypothetical protein